LFSPCPQSGRCSRRSGCVGSECSITFWKNDPEGQAYVRAFLQALQESGWIVDRNLRIDYRWSGGDPDRTRKYAAELVALAPDVTPAAGGSQVGPLQHATRTIPIVLVQVADAVGGGFTSLGAGAGGRSDRVTG
jgi:putative tryptophan/tyrosine transport system substrate-binding protein